MGADEEDPYYDPARPKAHPLQVAIALVGVVGVGVASAYFVATESGPARWLIDLQMGWHGRYGVKATWVWLTLIGVLLFAAVFGAVIWVAKRIRPSA